MVILEKFRSGVNLYRESRWNEAGEYFEKILELDPYDKPSQEYLRRCKEFENSPPPADWEGCLSLGVSDCLYFLTAQAIEPPLERLQVSQRS